MRSFRDVMLARQTFIRAALRPPAVNIKVTVLGNEELARYVASALRVAPTRHSTAADAFESAGGWCGARGVLVSASKPLPATFEVQWLPDQCVLNRAGKHSTDILVCDKEHWDAEPRGRRRIFFRSADGYAPAMIAVAHHEVNATEWDLFEEDVGACLVAANRAPGLPRASWWRRQVMNAPGMRAGRVIGAQLNAQAAALGQMTIDDSFIGAMILMLAFPARFRDAADVAYVAATADFRPGAPICPIVRTSEGFHRRKRQLTRRCAALDILPPGEALGLARLMHACLRTFVGHALYPDQRVNLGDLAQAVGIRGGSHESPSGASARRTLNALAAHHFEGISFATLVESLDPEEYVRVFGSLLLRSLWGRPEPPPIWVAELPVFENRRQLVRFVLRKLRERCSVAIRRPRRRQP